MKKANPLIKAVFLGTAGIGSLAMSSAALAQEIEDARDGPGNPVDDEEALAEDGIIVVTAGKREQTLQEIPVAVSVTSAETIEDAQIRDLLDLQSVVPSLRVDQLQSSANTNFIIRGFGNGANNPGIEPSVGVFIDGVYRSRSGSQIGDLPNVKRIEVLRGPQSTLFGKNASAGVISIVTQEPQFQFGGSVALTYGNFDTKIAKADITGPLTDTIAFSLSGNINKRDGYARDLNLGIDVNERDRWGVRGQILFEPSDVFKIRLIGDYDKIDEVCCTIANIIDGPTGDAVRAVGGQILSEQPFAFAAFTNTPSTNDIENYGGSAQIDYQAGALSFTSITAYREVRSDTNQDSDFTSADLIGENRAITSIDTFTQELRVTSDFDGPINFLLGGYYFDENIDFSNTLLYGDDIRGYADILTGGGVAQVEGILGVPVGTFFQPGQGNFDQFTFSNTAYSVFGQVDLKVTDRLTLTGGFNYTDDSKKVTSNVITTDAFSALDLVAIGGQVITQQGIATTVGGLLGLPGPANAAQIGAFAAANPAGFAQVQAGAQAFANANQTNPNVNPLLALQPLQFLPPFLNIPNAVEDGRTDDDKFTYTVRANYEVTDNINVYLTYATGFKASSFNLSRDSRPSAADFIPGSPVTNPPSSPIRDAGLALPNLTTGTRFASPENSEVYEIGMKAQFDNVAFNLAVFQQSIKGFQSNVFTGTGFALVNAGKQSTFGFEFDGTVTPVEPLTLFLAVTYLDPKYDSFVNSSFGDISGQTPSGIPPVSMSIGGTYTHEFDSGSELRFRTDYLYESPSNLVDGLAGFSNGFAQSFKREINQLNAAVTLELTNGLEISGYVRNLLDDKVITTIFPAVAQAGSISGYPNQPRTYGGTIRFKF